MRTSEFWFGAGHERVVQQNTNGTKTFYVGSLFEKVTSPGNLVELKDYIMTPLGRTAVHTVRSDSTVETRYLHQDALGSIDAVTNEYGQVEKRFTYDAWGKRATPVDNHTGSGGKMTRGFTDHEMLDDFGLIHMNGRIYDPLLGRFLSADITVQFPGDLQSYNRYSYVRNNPVTAIDPTGWYDVGGHLFATYIIAVAAGFDSDRASRLAHYSNYPDEHRGTSASTTMLKTGFDMIFHHDRLITAQQTLHMLNGAEGSAVFGIRASLQAEISDCSSDPKRGLLIHALGDAYAHSNEGLSANAASRVVKLFKSPFGHLFRGHAPDEIIASPCHSYDTKADASRCRTEALQHPFQSPMGMRIDPIDPLCRVQC